MSDIKTKEKDEYGMYIMSKTDSKFKFPFIRYYSKDAAERGLKEWNEGFEKIGKFVVIEKL